MRERYAWTEARSQRFKDVEDAAQLVLKMEEGHASQGGQ